MYYETHGQGEPLLLLHAGTLSADMWQPYLAAFTAHYRVIAPDMRGHGRSDNPTGAMSYRQLADEVVAFTRALDLHKLPIAGFSDGGQVALEIGMRYPDLPRSLIVGGVWFQFTAKYRAWARDALGDEETPEVDTARLARDHPDWAAWLEQIYGPDDWKPLLIHIKRMWTTPLNYTPDDFARVVAPTLVLLGDRDELVSIDEAAEMYRLLPAAELAVVPGANHGAFFSRRSPPSNRSCWTSCCGTAPKSLEKCYPTEPRRPTASRWTARASSRRPARSAPIPGGLPVHAAGFLVLDRPGAAIFLTVLAFKWDPASPPAVEAYATVSTIQSRAGRWLARPTLPGQPDHHARRHAGCDQHDAEGRAQPSAPRHVLLHRHHDAEDEHPGQVVHAHQKHQQHEGPATADAERPVVQP
jgi:pimeloyl-ACP methyl ester carboxylesterase